MHQYSNQSEKGFPNINFRSPFLKNLSKSSISLNLQSDFSGEDGILYLHWWNTIIHQRNVSIGNIFDRKSLEMSGSQRDSSKLTIWKFLSIVSSEDMEETKFENYSVATNLVEISSRFSDYSNWRPYILNMIQTSSLFTGNWIFNNIRTEIL